MKNNEYIYHSDCHQWVGYKPCLPQRENRTNGCTDCVFYSPILGNYLIIEAGGLGSILRTTVVSKELKKQIPGAKVQWLTHKDGAELLQNVPSVDTIVTADTDGSFLALQGQRFDQVINYESAPVYLGLTSRLKSKEKSGFEMSNVGNLIPTSTGAIELLRLQTDDQVRRRVNSKPMQQILLELAGFKWNEQTYDLVTQERDDRWAATMLSQLGIRLEPGSIPIGLNIGSTLKHDAKRWAPENFYLLTERFLQEYPDLQFVILAGPDEKEAYSKLLRMQSLRPLPNLIFTGTDHTISQFISLVDRMPIIVSADTFGVHAGIALGKNMVSLHGPQPEQEIYLYQKGQKISLNLDCAPCFALKESHCRNPQKLKCMSDIEVGTVHDAIAIELQNLQYQTEDLKFLH